MKEAQVSLKLQFMDHFRKRGMFQNFVHPTAVKGACVCLLACLLGLTTYRKSLLALILRGYIIR